MTSLRGKTTQAQAKTTSDSNSEKILNLYEILEIETTAQIQDGKQTEATD